MKNRLALLGLVVFLTACGEEQQAQSPEELAATGQAKGGSPSEPMPVASASVDKAALVNEAKEAVMALAGPLKAQLQAAIKTGGPAAAVQVCQTIAPGLAQSVSAAKGVDIKRVSLKNRNPVMGVPSTWQAAVLHEFETRKDLGEELQTLSYAEVVGNEFRFMKAVPTDAVCLNCHGVDLKPDVAAKLKELYPSDMATGFKEGDIRGAFVVTKNLMR